MDNWNQKKQQIKKSIVNQNNHKQDKEKNSIFNSAQLIAEQNNSEISSINKNQNSQTKIKLQNNETREDIFRNQTDKIKQNSINNIRPNKNIIIVNSGSNEQNEKKLKRLESLIKIKNEELLLKIKIKFVGLLEDFGYKNESNQINNLKDQNQIFDFVGIKLIQKLRSYQVKEIEKNQQQLKQRLLLEQLQQNIRYLQQSNQFLQKSQNKLKLKLEQIKKQNNLIRQNVCINNAQLQQKDNEIFKLKKLYQESQLIIHRIQINEKKNSKQKEEELKNNSQTIKDLRNLLTNYNLERTKLEDKFQQKNELCSELSIKLIYVQEENDKLNRQITRWKQRYQWLEKQSQNKTREYLNQLQRLNTSFIQYKAKNNQQDFEFLKQNIEEGFKQIEYYKQQYFRMEEQASASKNELNNYKKNLVLEYERLNEQFDQKYKKLQLQKENELIELKRQNEQLLSYISKQNEKLLLIKLQQNQNIFQKKINRLQSQFAQKIISIQQQNYQLKSLLQKFSSFNPKTCLDSSILPNTQQFNHRNHI